MYSQLIRQGVTLFESVAKPKLAFTDVLRAGDAGASPSCPVEIL